MTTSSKSPSSPTPRKRPGRPKAGAADQAKPSKSRAAKRRANTRATGRPGPDPLVLKGYVRAKDTWKAGSPASLVLAALRSGATWELAAKIGHLNQATPREWNTRGAEILAGLGEPGTELARNAPAETAAYLAFHLAAEESRVSTVVNALMTIDRASRTGNVAAAEIVLKRHPDAKPYRPDPRLELTGPEGGPIPITVRDEAKAKLERMADRLAANKPAAEPAPEPEAEAPPGEA